MEVVHRTRQIRIAPRKLRLVADQVRYLPVEQALSVLPLVNKGGALHIHKSLKAARQQAEDASLDPASLVIRRIFCDEGPAMKRLVMHSRGRASRIMKKYSHLSIVLSGEPKARGRRKAATPAKAEPSQGETEAAPTTASEGKE